MRFSVCQLGAEIRTFILVLLLSMIGTTGPSCVAGEESSKLGEIDAAFEKALNSAEHAYRSGLVPVVKTADTVEILLLDFDMERARDCEPGPMDSYRYIFSNSSYGQDVPEANVVRYFVISPYRKATRVIKATTINRDDANWSPLQSAIEKNLLKVSDHVEAMGHLPTWGVRVLRGRKLLFETSVSARGGSFFIDYGRYAKWCDVAGTELQNILKKMSPLSRSYESGLGDYGRVQ